MMRNFCRELTALSIVLVVSCLAAGQDKSNPAILRLDDGAPISTQIADLVTSSHASASIVLAGTCSVDNSIEGRVVAPEQKDYRSLKDALTAFLRANQGLESSYNGQLWHIQNVAASSDLLKVRISHLRVTSYSSADAEGQIMRSREVRKFFKERRVRWAASGGGLASVYPTRLPHKTLVLQDVTVAEALDRVLQQYPGVWLFQECQRADGMQLVQFEAFGSFTR